jgi:hypothetical protein
VRCAVAPQLIGYQPPRFASLAFQQPTKEAFRCTLIGTGLDKNINYISVVVVLPSSIVAMLPEASRSIVGT